MIIPEHLLRNGITEGMFMSARLCGRPLDGITFSQPPMGEPPAAMFAGLDLGQAQDFTALVICERTMKADPAKGMRQEPHLAVRHIHRWQLGTPYPAIVADVKELYANPPLQRTTLAIDRTGVGRAVVDQFVAADIRAAIHPWTITFGQGSVAGHSVAKIELVGAVQTLLGTKRLKIAPSLPLADTLAKELELFRVKVTADRNETFEAWRERDHDDLVLALALAAWTATLPVPNIR